jgi:hypothetical protein
MATNVSDRSAAPVEDARFHAGMAVACVLIGFGGFAPTYWLQLPAGTFVGPPLVHVHGLVFSAWPLFLLSQAWLASRGRLRQHRAWGLAGIALASAMVLLGVAAAILTLQHGLAAGYGDVSRAFFMVPMTALAMFAGFVIAAIVRRTDRGWHQRLMVLATVSLLQAAVARVFFVLLTGGGPGLRPGLGAPPPLVVTMMPAFLLELFIVAGIVHDWRRHGRPHPAWIVGAVVMTAVALLRVPLATTAGWLGFAQFMAGFAG